jgi:hypothetical protein
MLTETLLLLLSAAERQRDYAGLKTALQHTMSAQYANRAATKQRKAARVLADVNQFRKVREHSGNIQ